ncbi:50S ribosomal protein L4, partial [Bifidobacterium animalis subsp. lactis]|uniref:50S ribosomal protein L4 n=1 Tax=Bifidobacterium animalis TaxID=28025 RepID=UPI000DE5E985
HYRPRTPNKRTAAALRYARSDRANNGRVAVVDFQRDAPSTKKAIAALASVVADNFTTVVLARDNVNEWLAGRNIPTVYPIFAEQLNTYDVITAQYVVFSKDGL